MGNKKSRFGESIYNLYVTADAKASWMLEFYLRERFHDEVSGNDSDVEDDQGRRILAVSSNQSPRWFRQALPKTLEILKSGRRIGRAGLEKILENSKPIAAAALSSGNVDFDCLSVLCSLVLDQLDSDARDVSSDLFSNRVHSRQRRELRSFIRTVVSSLRASGFDPARLNDHLETLVDKLKVRCVEIGLNFETSPHLVTVERLLMWSHWCGLHLLAKVLLLRRDSLAAADILATAPQYRQDLALLLRALKANLKKTFSLEFREESYHTFPVSGQKRWWVDALVRIAEQDTHSRWRSEERKFGQVCLTYGHPGTDYVQGSVLCEHYLCAWDCGLSELYQCGQEFQCVKCCFIDKLMEEVFGPHKDMFGDFANYGAVEKLILGLDKFEIMPGS